MPFRIFYADTILNAALTTDRVRAGTFHLEFLVHENLREFWFAWATNLGDRMTGRCCDTNM